MTINMETQYNLDQREKILSLARELLRNKEITYKQLLDTYFNLYITNK